MRHREKKFKHQSKSNFPIRREEEPEYLAYSWPSMGDGQLFKSPMMTLQGHQGTVSYTAGTRARDCETHGNTHII